MHTDHSSPVPTEQGQLLELLFPVLLALQPLELLDAAAAVGAVSRASSGCCVCALGAQGSALHTLAWEGAELLGAVLSKGWDRGKQDSCFGLQPDPAAAALCWALRVPLHPSPD